MRPRDIAVISYRHADLADAQAALLDVGVPGVIAGGGSVFATPAGGDWLTLLEALEQPHRSTRVRSAALTCFFGHTAADLDARGDDLTDEVAETLRTWLELFGSRGLAAVMEAASIAGLPARVLAEVGGDRRLTDLRHIGEALHEVALTERHGLVSLLTWLREQVGEGRAGRGLERTRRLDSDAAAVQLVTIHASKGLEYPVVYLPAVSDRHVAEPDLPRFHDDAGRRCRNVGAGGAGWADHVRRAQEEDAGEWLRLLYVALTRAQSQVVCWWSPTKNTLASPLHRMLMRPADSSEVPDQPPVPSDDDAVALFAPVARPRRAGPGARDPAGPPGPGAGRGGPGARRARLHPDRRRRLAPDVVLLAERGPRRDRASDAVASEPEVVGKDDEDLATRRPRDGPRRPSVDQRPTCRPRWRTCRSARRSARSCTRCSSTPTRPRADFRAELLGHIDEQRGWWPVELDREELADALVAVCDSPLGGPDGPLGGVTLRGVPLTDRLREMDFELPLAGGDVRDRTADVRLGDLAPLLERHLPEGDPVRAYAVPLRGPLGDQALRGYLTGSVDVVLRVPTADGPRFHVVDYKTNWLGPFDEPLTAAAYRPEAMDAAMGHSDYPLQALLYAAVLHRFLRWRLPGYDPERHLGEVLYLYVRGMCGPDTPLVDGIPCGVFAWRAPVPLVEELSDLLAGRVAASMTELFEPTSEHDWRLARGRTGLLAAFNDGLLLTSADLHVAARVGALGREDDERVLLALALAVRAVRRGSVCLVARRGHGPRPPTCPGPTRTAWADAVRRSTLVDAGVLRWDHRPAVPRPLPPPRDPGLRRPRRPCLAAGAGRRRGAAGGRGWRRYAASTRAPSRSRPPRRPCGGGRRSSPAAPAPARRPRSPGCWRCWPTRPPRAASGSRSR